MPFSYVIIFAPIGRRLTSSGVNELPQPFKNPLVYVSNNSMLQETRLKLVSSSSAVLAPVRIESPKSFITRPGITVSRSITQIPFPVRSSIITLFNLVSLCVTRRESSPLSRRSINSLATALCCLINSISRCTLAARPQTSSATARSNV